MVIQFGINMLVPILLCTFLGIFLDRLLSTSFIVIILFFLGAIAGFRNIFIIAKQMNGKTTHIGSDLEESVGKQKTFEKEDFLEKMDRVYKENRNE